MVTNDLLAGQAHDAAVAPPTTAPSQPGPQRPRAWIALAATAGLTVTVLTSGTSLVEFAYASVPLHVAVEVVAAMASAIAAQLAYGRFRATLALHDVLLVAALVSFAAANLLFGAVPAVFDAHPGQFATWAPVGGALVSAALLAGAAFAPSRPLHRPARAARRAFMASAVSLATIAALVSVAGDALPPAVAAHTTPTELDGPRITADPFVLATQLVSMLLFAAAAVRFAARDARSNDVLSRWLAVGATLGAFARLNYALFPSLYTQWFYAGDILRLSCFLAIFVGAVLETRRLQGALSAAAVIGERRRIARDLHDGVAQDLAFIVQQLRDAVDRDRTPPPGRLLYAAERALDGSRQAMSALTPVPDRPFADAIAATAREAGEREGSAVETDVPAEVVVTPRVHAELLRVVREAVINAARHGRARHIRVAMWERAGVYLEIADDGQGFDVAARTRFGLTTMRERVTAIGGELSVVSEPGRGTRVEVMVP